MINSTQKEKKLSSVEKMDKKIKSSLKLVFFYGILFLSMFGGVKLFFSVAVILGVFLWIKHMYKGRKEAQNFQRNNRLKEEENITAPVETHKEKPKFRKGLDGILEDCTEIGENEKPIEIKNGFEIYAYLGDKKTTIAKYCSQCGQSIPMGGVYCTACGKKLVLETTPQSSIAQRNNIDQMSSIKILPKESHNGFGVTSLVLALVGIVIGQIFFGPLAIVFGFVGWLLNQKYSGWGIIIGIFDLWLGISVFGWVMNDINKALMQ